MIDIRAAEAYTSADLGFSSGRETSSSLGFPTETANSGLKTSFSLGQANRD
jgi:hypothetical protein